MNLLNRVGGLCAVVAVCVFCANDLVAQPQISSQGSAFHLDIPNYRNMTLDFENVTSTMLEQTTIETTSNEKAIEFGDYDRDGDLDVVMAVAHSDFGQRLNKLYRNDIPDGGKMLEVSASVVPGFASTDVGRIAFFRDFDKDGWLDIVVVCDQNSGTGSFEAPGRTKYYRNVNGTTFVNESNRIPTGGMGAACNGTAEDFNQDGWCDFLMCNYPNVSQDTLYMNQGAGGSPGFFLNMTSTLYPAENNYGVHSEAADMNGDSKLDILMANWSGNSSYIYYNDNNDAGSGIGDFRYSGAGASTIFSGSGGGAEIAMVPGDFNNDGLMDFYYTNKGGSFGSRTDVIMVNSGNDGNNKATFNTVVEMPAIQNNETHKVTVNDLDRDGFVDLIIMDEVRRPYIYRNTSVAGGEVSFVQWTPTPAFPAGTLLRGWQANSAQILGDERPDIFVGGYNDDFLFENLKSNEYDFRSGSGGALPDFHNLDPIAVWGDASKGQTDVFTKTINAGANVSVILRSAGDVTLEVWDGNNLVASSAKGLFHTTEAVEFSAPGGTLEFRVTMNRVIYDGDDDGDIDRNDFYLMWQCINDNDDCPVFDLSNSNGVTAFDAILFPQRMTGHGGQAEESYILELLSRTN